jgi:hypothetical protein
MKISKIIYIIILPSLALFYIFTWTGFDSNLEEYIKGDYTTAVKQFREAAEQGDASAQHNLAIMYDSGKGVPQDDAEAMKWYFKAAEQGYADSQYNLGMMYYFGKGVSQDYITAYKWLILANTQEEDYTKDAMAALAEKMSHEQIAKAQEAAQAWKEEYSN